MLWLLSLPFQLAGGLIAMLVAVPLALVLVPLAVVLWLPFMLLRLVLKVVTTLVLLPLIAIMTLVGLIVGGIALAAAVLIPLLPFMFFAVCAWILWRMLASPRTYPA